MKPAARTIYYALQPQKRTRDQVENDFISTFFDTPQTYYRYRDEFASGPAASIRDTALTEYRKMTCDDDLGGISLETGARYYALIRHLQPDTVVETGVCNGISTLCILLALNENNDGRLYSVDYPYYADELLDDFRQKTFDEYGGAAIPRGKEPGWIIPDQLRERWELLIDKSQVQLPELRQQIDGIDMFVHDSEHSLPCMLFEFELAWEWLNPGGILVADDITWNDAFDRFTVVRDCSTGHITKRCGYAIGPEAER